eukprot:CAMPEP_0197464280 /NCGR_PEP_ID=MMETSP1175-20131217/63938_1 /TAXON_ID=1003142 /ORGANISM="Triceratium dubium, Strain CCMP147" /LENGTH=728 /DNA_ID=CAMNT_0043000251 /DNA_START=99 /DNA_END=2282 /DNA_ORIENTATION=+
MVETPICPITLEPIEDPVLAIDGHTYERSAIEAWIRLNGTSPQTRELLRVEDLIPICALQTVKDEQEPPTIKDTKNSCSDKHPSLPEEIYELLSTMVKSSARMSTANPEQIVLNIDVPDSSECTFPNHICCVIDVSGSMQVEAPCKDETGKETSTGLSVLDVVKFAALVISQSLGPNDQLSIVKFSDRARTVLPPTSMDGPGKKAARDALKGISVEGRTNLWAGLAEGVKLANQVGDGFNNSVFVLTDGLPNIDPPLGYTRSLNRLLSQTPVYGNISTFGFGYSLDSSLLNELSRLGGGYFSFIPDAGFVGTCFINAVANARCAFGLKPRIIIQKSIEENGFKALSSDSQLCVSKMGEGERITSIHLSPLRYGQSLDIVLNNKHVGLDDLATVEFCSVKGHTVTIPIEKTREDSPFPAKDEFHSVRTTFVKDVHEVLRYRGSRRGRSRSVSEKTKFETVQGKRGFSDSEDTALSALIEDIEGQATEALSEEFFDRWGKHYLLSLSGAHLHQFCNNFKDPGVQLYGEGRLFRALQEDLNDIFEALPPPKPSARRRQPGPALSSMSGTFNNRNTVCVHGNTMVTILREKVIRLPIAKVQRGDKVLTSGGSFVGVRCVVQTEVETSEPLVMVRLGGLLVTPYHPVLVKGKWKFPIDAEEGVLVELDSCDAVYNLVLEKDNRSSAVLMDGIPCISLGHGIEVGDVLPHPFFGTNEIIENLKSNFPHGWNEGW